MPGFECFGEYVVFGISSHETQELERYQACILARNHIYLICRAPNKGLYTLALASGS